MTYRITGLSPEPFVDLIGKDDAALANLGALRVTAGSKPGYPCRITLEDAEPGETLILLNHVSHDVATPYRSADLNRKSTSPQPPPTASTAMPPKKCWMPFTR